MRSRSCLPNRLSQLKECEGEKWTNDSSSDWFIECVPSRVSASGTTLADVRQSGEETQVYKCHTHLVSTRTPATVLLCPLPTPAATPTGLPIVPDNCGVGVDEPLPPAAAGASCSGLYGFFPLEFVIGELPGGPDSPGAVKEGMADSSTSSSTSVRISYQLQSFA
jgi:hypothetical protein